MRKPCCEKEGTNKGAWSKQEDQKLIDYIKIHGEGCWRSLPKAAGLHRCGKSCRLRWINYLRPDIKRGNFGQDEEDLIIKLHALLGNRWSLIAGRLPGRTDNEVKNYWNSHVRKKLLSMGVDPNNHRLNQLNNNCSPPPPPPAAVITSTPSTKHACKKPLKSLDVVVENERRASDECLSSSCLEEEEEATSDNSNAGSPTLNLDLTIAFPNNSRPLLLNKQEMETNTFPTLVLFN